jgi:hypothetical protein
VQKRHTHNGKLTLADAIHILVRHPRTKDTILRLRDDGHRPGRHPPVMWMC